MEPDILNLPREQFLAALDELQLDPARRDDLVRQYRRANSPFASIYGLLDRVAAEDAGQGMQRAAMLPVARPEGMSVAEAVRAGEAQFAVPQSLVDLLGGSVGAIDAPSAAALGLIPAQDMPAEALGTAGVAMGAGGLLARPAGSVGMGGRVASDGFAEYLNRVNPGQRRIPAENRPNLGMGDMYGMLPRNARKVGERDGVKFYEADGDFYATAYNPDVQEMDVVGYAINSGDGTDLQVVSEMQGSGIGGELQYLYRRANPDAPTGGLTEAGERTMRRTYDRLRDEGIVSANRSTAAGLLASAAETPAQRVARLLREGRASEVTDDLMAQADPQEMYRLYVAGETGMDLPMDEASRMARAREMGFSPALHGTGSDIVAVDPQFFGSGPDLLGSGFYTTTNPSRAERYIPREASPSIEVSRNYAEGGNILPLMVRERNPFLLEERLGEAAEQMARSFAEDPFFSTSSMSSGVNYVTDADGRRVMLDPLQPRHYAVQNVRREFGPQEVTNVLSDLGYSGVSGPEGMGNRVRVSFDPQDVRSRFARFDPRLSHLANLNAANVDPITGLFAMMQAQEQQQ